MSSAFLQKKIIRAKKDISVLFIKDFVVVSFLKEERTASSMNLDNSSVFVPSIFRYFALTNK